MKKRIVAGLVVAVVVLLAVILVINHQKDAGATASSADWKITYIDQTDEKDLGAKDSFSMKGVDSSFQTYIVRYTGEDAQIKKQEENMELQYKWNVETESKNFIDELDQVDLEEASLSLLYVGGGEAEISVTVSDAEGNELGQQAFAVEAEG